MSQVDIDSLRKLLARATPGPWEARIAADDPKDPTSAITSWIESEEHMGFCGNDMNEVVGRDGAPGVSTHENAELIVALRNAAPALLDEIEWLRREVDELRKYRRTHR